MNCAFHALRPLLALGLASVALTGCGRDKAADPKAQAAGEVLPGSISDAMLPLDTVRSQPPLAPRAEASGKAITSGDKATAPDHEPEAAAEGDAPPAEAPAEAPASPGAQ